MGQQVREANEQFLCSRLVTREEALRTPSPVPEKPGVYGWWFRQLPAAMDTSGCATTGGLTLLYTGISPKRPPGNGRQASGQNLRERIRTHYAGHAEGSTLRKTLGCLLSDALGSSSDESVLVRV
jgi:hypothetical protein